MPRQVPYDKLVRDRIPEIILKDGHGVEVVRAADLDQHVALLRHKIDEELSEYDGASSIMSDAAAEELVDLYEVILTLFGVATLGDVPTNSEYIRQLESALKKQAETKRRERGGFGGGVILNTVTEYGDA